MPQSKQEIYVYFLEEYRLEFPNKTLWSVHFGVVVVEQNNCKCEGIARNEIW